MDIVGSIYHGIPPEIALRLKDKYDLQVFLETGTYMGKSAIWAAEFFDRVYTIESNYTFYIKTVGILHGLKNVIAFHGHSQDMLSIALTMFSEKALIWLDAHWSKDLGYKKYDKTICPVLEEINAISKNDSGHVILIDDVRLFGKAPGWPTVKQVVEVLKNTGRKVTIEKDVFIAIPE